MNDPDELKVLALRHARRCGISYRCCANVLSRIRTDDRGLPGSWVWEWRRAGEILEQNDRLRDAFRYYEMASFPYVDGEARQYALDRCLSVFNRWRQSGADIQRLDLSLEGYPLSCWTTGLSATKQRPVLLIIDDLVTTKEHGAALLATIRRLGMAGVAIEMPGVGENKIRYDANSWKVLSAVLDALSGHADAAETYAMAFSFGGHLALRCAIEDERIRGIITADPPVRDFFDRIMSDQGMSPVMLAAIAHMTQVPIERMAGPLRELALTEDMLSAVNIPVYYTTGWEEELVQCSELPYLQRHVRDLRLIKSRSMYRSSWQSAATRLWASLAILRLRGRDR